MNIPLIANSQGGSGIVSNGLIIHYSMNEGTGDVLYDSSGYFNNSILTGSYVWDYDPRGKSAVKTNNTSAFARSNRLLNMDNGSAGTCCFWFRTSLATNNNYICGNGNWSTDRNGFNVAISNTRIYAEVCSATGRSSITGSIITGNEWKHHGFVWTTTGLRYYFNGVLGNTAAQAQQIVVDVYQFSVARDGSNTYRLTNPSYIDDVRVYNRALNADEIYTIYKSTGG